MAAGMAVSDRYRVMSPHIWLDTQPGQAPTVLETLPDVVLPYMRLYPYRLHLPSLHGFYQRSKETTPILLLDNVPIDRAGQPYPSVGAIWGQTAPLRQVYWLWQILQLWGPLQSQGVASSLLVPSNVRVEGWRVRLRELYADAQADEGEELPPAPSLKALGDVWLSWVGNEETAIAEQVRELSQYMQKPDAIETIWTETANRLNQLLLEQAAESPLYLNITGATTTGPQRTHNEDACYPNPTDPSLLGEKPLPGLAIVCDGIGGHAGGEVASQLALRSLQLQIRALLTEVAEQPELTEPDIIMQQLAALIRVVNNTIAAQNNEQGRELRQRMGTTLVLALQVPQKIATAGRVGNSHELYLAHVGDSRAYWITPSYCHLLTVDDDVTSREIRLGRSLHYESQRRPDAGALTQALGTREGETLYPTVQRFILDEEGVLLLCSDGLSDNGLIEQSWEGITRSFFKGKMSLEQLVDTWVALANEHNGHDNTSVVALHCRVSQEEPALFTPEPELPGALERNSPLSEASRALLYDEETEAIDADGELEEDGEPESRSPNWLALAFGFLVLLLVAGGIGLAVWSKVAPDSFNQTWQRLINSSPEQPSPRP